MKNKIIIDSPTIDKKRITYHYRVEGDWEEVFVKDEPFYIEYNRDISSIPEGIAVVPLIANLLPMAWIYDAEIIVPICDKAFYDSIPEFKKGYIDMYPMMNLKGKINAKFLQENHTDSEGGAATFFSGGVDAFNTLICHVNEKPTLITLWGADIKLEDTAGWERVQTHLENTAQRFDVEFITVKSCFRRFLNEGKLSQDVLCSGDGWWHGFQHGIGVISHAAPIAYIMKKNVVYFASTHTAADKGKVTCASDPTIDNYVRFGDTHIVHDCYEFTRQMKIHNIMQFSNKTGMQIPLRVCWESSGGSNCCYCEKCWRTILGIYAEGYDPGSFGFDFNMKTLKKLSKKMYYTEINRLSTPYRQYPAIQKTMHEHLKKSDLPKPIRWFYSVDVSNLDKLPIWKKAVRKLKRVLNKMFRKI